MKTGSSFSSSQRVLQRSMFRKAFPSIFLQFYFSWPNYLRWVSTIRNLSLRQRTLTFALMENGDITSSYITTCVLNAFLSYTAVMLNCLTIRALTKLSSLPRPLKTLLLSVAVSDLGVGLMVQPSYIASLVMEMEQKTQNNQAYNITYKFYVFTVNLFGYASLFGVTFLSLDRFLSVYLHLRYQELVTHKRVVVVMVSKWVFSAVLSFLRLSIPTRVSFIIFAIISLSLFS